MVCRCWRAWAAPVVLSLDPVAAATGSCGVKPRRVDFSRFAGNLLPSSFTSDDGSITITATTSDPFGVQDAFWATRVYSGTLNSRDDPVVTAMSNANFGEYVELTFTFSQPVEPSFHLVDIDRSFFSWQDTVRIQGSYLGGAPFAPDSMVTGAANTQLSPDTVQGVSSTSTATGNVEVDFQQPVDPITIRHSDTTSWTAFQWIAIHDFHWC